MANLLGVPPGPILIAEQHELAVPEPRLASGIMQDHQCEQSVHLGVVRKHLSEGAP